MPTLDEQLDQLKDLAKLAEKGEHWTAITELLPPYLDHRPDDAYAWYLLGDSLRRVGRNEAAKVALRRALALKDGERWYIEARLGMLHRDIGERSEAESWFARSTADSDAAAWVWLFRGGNLAWLDRNDEAIRCHRHVADMHDSDRGEALVNIALIHHKQRRYSEALVAIREAIGISPQDSAAQELICTLEGIKQAITAAATVPHP